MHRDSTAPLRLVQHAPKPTELPGGQEPLARPLPVLDPVPARVASLGQEPQDSAMLNIRDSKSTTRFAITAVARNP